MSEAIKLIRSPIDTNCVHCPSKIPFGVWTYYEPSTGNAICIECATTKGWMPKDRVNQIIQKLELQEDIKALRKQRKIESDALLLMKREVDVYQVAEEDRKLSGQLVRLMATVEDYMKSIGDEEEKKALKAVFEETRKCQELQREVRAVVKNRLVLFEKRRKKLPVETTTVSEEEILAK
jgi:hypothetical protein